MKKIETLGQLMKAQKDPEWRTMPDRWALEVEHEGVKVACVTFRTREFAESAAKIWKGYSVSIKRVKD